MVRSSKTPKRKAEAERLEALRVQGELAVFGDGYQPRTEEELAEPEVWWSKHYQWLKDRGYLLRPRYAPDWVPSWKGTKKDSLLCEDSRTLEHATILDATRLSDGAFVTLKIIQQSIHPHEVEIGQFFSSEPLRSQASNHCVPIYDVLRVPTDSDSMVIVMPLLREYTSPPFSTIGEAVECFRQLFEGLQFMHRNRVAHRDCMHLNIMMDASKLYTDAFHPIHPIMKRDFSGYAHFKSRTTQPVKYYFIDFGLSRRYDPSIARPLEIPIWGGDKEVPEFQKSNNPCDPFPTDIFYLGNMIKKDFVQSSHGFDFMEPLIADMTQDNPSKRPNINEVITRFETIRKGLTPLKLRSRVVDKQEGMLGNTVQTVLHWVRQLGYVARRLPATPPPPT